MFPDIAAIEAYCEVNGKEKELLGSQQRPIVLLKKKADGRRLAEGVCGFSPDIGAMIPCNPLQTLLLEELGPLIMTSANGSGGVLFREDQKMADWLTERADCCGETFGLLGHDRPVVTPLDDSIVRVICGRTQVFRRARGFVPEPVAIDVRKKIFAAGGDLKACFCYTANGRAYMSQHLGDLEEEECYNAYRAEADRMRRLFSFEPDFWVCDLHPSYRFTEKLTGALKVQHHEAHVAAVIAEHGLRGAVLGFAFDGTGYGRDKSIWGSETFFWDGYSMKRVAHIKPVMLIGGDEGARNADTILYSYFASFGQQTQKLIKETVDFLPWFDFDRAAVIEKAIACRVNTAASSSMGRLFDAVSAFLGVCHYSEYEGQAAIELEQLAATAEKGYPLSMKILHGEAHVTLGDPEMLFVEMARAIRGGIPRKEIARGFIDAVSDYIYDVCDMIQNDVTGAYGLWTRQVALSGGTFQNRILLERTIGQLEAAGFEVYVNEKVPGGDGGICIGQAYLCERLQ